MLVFKFLLALGLCVFLESVPIKVPTYRYKGGFDKSSHPGHYPYISYLTFRNFSDKVIDDQTEWFDPSEMKKGDILYVNVWYLEWFVEHIHDKIPYPYILVTCDVGAWLPDPSLARILYDPKLAAWFCKNSIFSYHPKIFQLPMGQDLGQFILDDPNITQYLSEAAKKCPREKKHLLYMCHYPRKSYGRDIIVKLFENEPYCLTRNRSDRVFEGLSRPDFYEEMSLSKFVVSPLGLEVDSVRTWEALVLGTIPIVEHTFLDPLYERLPVLVIDKWEEITAEFLEQKYEELQGRSCEEAYFDYWAFQIKELQKKVKNETFEGNALEKTLFSSENLEDLKALLVNEKGALPQSLLWKGFLSTLRPFQVAKELNSFILLSDPWMNDELTEELSRYIKPPFLIEKNKVLLFDFEEMFLTLLPNFPESVTFLDLSYYRAALIFDCQGYGLPYEDIRPTLSSDLKLFYNAMMPGSTLTGNMLGNEYVLKIITEFAQEKGLILLKKGEFWSLKKGCK